MPVSVASRAGRGSLTRPSLTGSSADAEDDRDRRGRRFGRKRRRSAARRYDHGHLTANQIGRQSPAADRSDPRPSDIRSRRFGLRRSRLHCRPWRNASQILLVRIGETPLSRNPITRHRRLLRARRERPRRRRTAEQRDELPPPDVEHWASSQPLTLSLVSLRTLTFVESIRERAAPSVPSGLE